MRVIDPGHKYALKQLDGEGEEILTFVKREGKKYPGNVGAYPGTNFQECFRALIDRAIHLNNQDPHNANRNVVAALRESIFDLEIRAAIRHGRNLTLSPFVNIENELTCPRCGHIGCKGECH